VNTDTSRLVAWAQIWIALILVVGVFAVLILLLLKRMDIDQQAMTIVTSILGSVASMAMAAVAYFFARHRPSQPGDVSIAGPSSSSPPTDVSLKVSPTGTSVTSTPTVTPPEIPK
jgi:hypothetical protein